MVIRPDHPTEWRVTNKVTMPAQDVDSDKFYMIPWQLRFDGKTSGGLRLERIFSLRSIRGLPAIDPSIP